MNPLDPVLDRFAELAIAVSGGVDSMTLAAYAHERLASVTMIHAVSPAVPAAATQRVKEIARQRNWNLRITDAGEFSDPNYRANPVNRCYFCKSNLYQRIADLTSAPVASGANADDLGDFRPGLTAAAEHQVVHPYLEAGMGKAAVRALATELDLPELAVLPAQPCLASRVETGIAIDADDLAFVDRLETAVRETVDAAASVRCRITHGGVALELSPVPSAARHDATAVAERLCTQASRVFLGTRPYLMGAAFLRGGQ